MRPGTDDNRSSIEIGDHRLNVQGSANPAPLGGGLEQALAALA
jgi:hypothetical protein